MDTITGLAIFFIIWGVLVLLIAAFKPQKIWKLGKIQGFVQLLGEKGATVLFIIIGLVAIIASVALLI